MVRRLVEGGEFDVDRPGVGQIVTTGRDTQYTTKYLGGADTIGGGRVVRGGGGVVQGCGGGGGEEGVRGGGGASVEAGVWRLGGGEGLHPCGGVFVILSVEEQMVQRRW